MLNKIQDSKVCPQCGVTMIADAINCPGCGVAFEVHILGYCTNCERQVEPDRKEFRCPRCHEFVLDWYVESKLKQIAPGMVAPTARVTSEMEIWPRQGDTAGRRFPAFLIDVAGILALYALLLEYLEPGLPAALFGPGWLQALPGLLQPYYLLPLAATWFLYFILFEGSFSASPGKALMRLQVIRPGGRPCGFGRAALRSFTGVIEHALLVVTPIAVWFTPLHQSLSDQIAQTMVVQKDRLLRAIFQEKSVLFEWHDGRKQEIANLSRGQIRRLGLWGRLWLEGQDAQKNTTALDIPFSAFPNAQKLDELKDALGCYAQIQFTDALDTTLVVIFLLATIIAIMVFVGLTLLIR